MNAIRPITVVLFTVFRHHQVSQGMIHRSVSKPNALPLFGGRAPASEGWYDQISATSPLGVPIPPLAIPPQAAVRPPSIRFAASLMPLRRGISAVLLWHCPRRLAKATLWGTAFPSGVCFVLLGFETQATWLRINNETSPVLVRLCLEKPSRTAEEERKPSPTAIATSHTNPSQPLSWKSDVSRLASKTS